MIKAIVFGAFLAIAGVIYYRYRKDGDLKEALFCVGLVVIAVSFSLFGRYLYIYKPLFIAHMILLLFSWVEVFRFIFFKKIRLWLVFSPLVTVALFFIIGYFFSKVEP